MGNHDRDPPKRAQYGILFIPTPVSKMSSLVMSLVLKQVESLGRLCQRYTTSAGHEKESGAGHEKGQWPGTGTGLGI